MGKDSKNCILEAYRLMLENGRIGRVYYVPRIGSQTVGHAYYAPDPEDLDAIALNHADNGFEQFPRLTVSEVIKHHDPVYLTISSD